MYSTVDKDNMYLHLLFSVMSMVLCLSNTDTTSVTANHFIPCKQGWFHFHRKCYNILGENNGLSWKQASVSCSLERGKLATIQSAELQEFLIMFLLHRVQKNAWIGLNDRKRESEFTWEDHSPLNYTNWDQKQPSGTGDRKENEDCVEMRFQDPRTKIGTWNDLSCDSERTYLCQADESANVSSQDPRFCSIGVGGGWKYQNSCYHVVTKEKSWEDAEYYCQEIFSGHLVTILDEKTEMFLSYVFPNYTENFWIGIKMRDQSLQVWSSDWHVIYKRWDHEPTHFLANTCGMMTKENLWAVGPCFRELPFICERSKNKAPALKNSPKGWRCPDLSKGWMDLNGDHCYLIETSKSVNWNEANYECGRKGGALASIRSEAESFILHSYVKDKRPAFYIGLHRSLSNKDVFEWADGSKFDFQNWIPGEPNSKKEECGGMWSHSMKWNDVTCEITYDMGYICSARKVPPKYKVEINASGSNECVCTMTSNTTEQHDDTLHLHMKIPAHVLCRQDTGK